MKNHKKRLVFWRLTGILCFLAAAVMAGMAGRTWLAYRDSENNLERMYQDVEQAVPEAESSLEDSASFEIVPDQDAILELWKDLEARNVSVSELKQMNPDTVGWIQIPGTVIDYPVMHTPEDPNYYYHRDYYGRYSVYGMIYLDGSCRLDGTSPNLLLYGHHMRNGTMFAAIENYQSEDYAKEHSLICLTTERGKELYEVMAALRVPADRLNEDFMKMLEAGNEEDYHRLIQYAAENSIYKADTTAVWPEQLITLTTCEYTNRDGRFLVIARRYKGE